MAEPGTPPPQSPGGLLGPGAAAGAPPRPRDEDPTKQGCCSQRAVTYSWAATQLFGPMAMPLWLAVFGTDWYTRVNLVPGEVALCVTISKCLDVFSDPMMACILRSCRMHTIAMISSVGALVQTLSFAFFFYPFHPMDPEGGHSRVFFQFLVGTVLFFLGDTLQGTPTNTLGTMLKSQNILNDGWHSMGLQLGSGAQVVGIVVMGAIWFAVSSALVGSGNEWDQDDGVQKGLYPWSNFWVAVGVGSVHVLINTAFVCIIRSYDDSTLLPEDENPRSAGDWLREYSRMLTESYNNPFFQQLLLAWTCDSLAQILLMKFLLWFVRHKVEPEMGSGCQQFEDPINAVHRPEKGFGTGVDKGQFECSPIEVTVAATLIAIFGMVVATVMWSFKIKHEKDELGLPSVWKNWLLFNLTGALTNALLVFVDRGDNRIFWVLILINAVPLGGLFMTDTILLYLITSEVWLRRDESGMPDAQRKSDGVVKDWASAKYAQVYDVHTTKFGMMKTFVPKAVSLVAEAAPLALMQIWYYNPRDMCSEPTCCSYVPAGVTNVTCKEYSPCGPLDPITDPDSEACGEFLRYNDTDAAKYVPQPQKVRQLVQFFFYMLPFVLCLVSWFLKRGFQVTDSADYWMRSKVMRGIPGIRPGSAALRVKEDVGAVKKTYASWERDVDGPDDRPRAELVVRLQDLAAAERAKKESGANLERYQKRLAMLFKPAVSQDPWLGRMVPTSKGRFLFRLPHYAENALAHVPGFVLRTTCARQRKVWPLPDFMTAHRDIDSSPMWFTSFLTGVFLAAQKVVLGLVWVLWFFFWALSRLLFCCSTLCRLQCENAGSAHRRLESNRKQLVIAHPLVFGVAGGSTVNAFAEKVLRQMAVCLLRTADRNASDSCIERLRVEEAVRSVLQCSYDSLDAQVKDGLAEIGDGRAMWAEGARCDALVRFLAAEVERGTVRPARDSAGDAVQRSRAEQLGGETVAGDVLVRERVYPTPRCCPEWRAPATADESPALSTGPTHKRVASLLHHLKYQSLGVTVFFCAVIGLQVHYGGGLVTVAQGPYSAVLTVSMFFAAIGLVLFFYYWGLLKGSSSGDAVAQERWDAGRPFTVDDLFALSVAHFNHYSVASNNPLIFGDTADETSQLLFALNAAVLPALRPTDDVQVAADAQRRTESKQAFFEAARRDPALWTRYTSYVLFVPAGRTADALEVLAPMHRRMDDAVGMPHRVRVRRTGPLQDCVRAGFDAKGAVKSVAQGAASCIVVGSVLAEVAGRAVESLQQADLEWLRVEPGAETEIVFRTPAGWDVHNIAPSRKWEVHADRTLAGAAFEVAIPDAPKWGAAVEEGCGSKDVRELYHNQEQARRLMRYCEEKGLAGFTVERQSASEPAAAACTVRFFVDHLTVSATEQSSAAEECKIASFRDGLVVADAAKPQLVGLMVSEATIREGARTYRTSVSSESHFRSLEGQDVRELALLNPRLRQPDPARFAPARSCTAYFRSWQAYPYRCFLYSWWDVQPQTREHESDVTHCDEDDM